MVDWIGKADTLELIRYIVDARYGEAYVLVSFKKISFRIFNLRITIMERRV